MTIKKNFKLIPPPKKSKLKPKLPKKLWKIMDITIADVKSVIASDNVKINLSGGELYDNGKCDVDLSEAVLIGTIGINKEESFYDFKYMDEISDWDKHVLESLEDISQGRLGDVHFIFSKGKACEFPGEVYSWVGYFRIDDVFDSPMSEEEENKFTNRFNKYPLKNRQAFFINYLTQLRDYWKKENI